MARKHHQQTASAGGFDARLPCTAHEYFRGNSRSRFFESIAHRIDVKPILGMSGAHN